MTATTSNQLHPPKHDAIGQYLLLLRSRARLTQSELATQIGVHRRSIQKWETGETYPSAENLRALIALLIDLGAFTSGQEGSEAAGLWLSASQDVPQPLEPFDPAWFDQLLDAHTGDSAPSSAAASLPADDRQWTQAPSGRGLPFQPTSFIGRSTELSEIARILADPACRLLTLLGPGGIGKTRLALEVAAGQTNAFRVGVVFCQPGKVGQAAELAAGRQVRPLALHFHPW
jgi:transcriptional regulator with XRE-family HTH domain